MGRKLRVGLMLAFMLLLVALPTSALANKQLFKARLSYANELHTVVGSTASGSAVLATNPDGTMHILVSVRGLSGAPTAAHIHGPADATQTAPPVVTLCGPANSVLGGPCPYDGSGGMSFDADFNAGALSGISGGAFWNALRDGLMYVNVHTSLNPAGEARGQLNPQ